MDANNYGDIKAPVIILSAPRAGSTLLFETLLKHPELKTIGGESHALIEHIPQLSTVARGYKSNRLDESDASIDVVKILHQRFIQSALDYQGNSYHAAHGECRLLEKTPKNALRVKFLNKVFPDAKFVYLVRDPRENISSIMEAWLSGHFMTYPSLPGWNGGWSLLLPDGWEAYIDKPLAAVARFQWQQANDSILESFSEIDSSRKMILNYHDFVIEPLIYLRKILDFANLDSEYAPKMISEGLAFSRYTITPPRKNKWQSNAREIAPEIQYLVHTVAQVNKWLDDVGGTYLGCEINLEQFKHSYSSYSKVARNEPCPCGSGRRYKLCHGQLT